MDDIPRQQIIHQYSGSADLKCGGELVEPIIETQRQYRQNAVIRRILQVLNYARCPRYQVSVGKDYALWLAGTSGRVKNRGHIAIDTMVRFGMAGCRQRIIP